MSWIAFPQLWCDKCLTEISIVSVKGSTEHLKNEPAFHMECNCTESHTTKELCENKMPMGVHQIYPKQLRPKK